MCSTSVLLLVLVSSNVVYCQNSAGNIYGYDTSNTGNSNNGLFLVQNPNYQFLNDQLANEYSQTYLEELRNYEQQQGGSSSGGIVTSSSSVPANGYYTGPALSNQQQNQVNYQQIVQRNPATYSNTGSSSSNIYGYAYSSGSSTSGSNTYNNQALYSAPSGNAGTAQPYVYPFGQFAPAGSSSSNPVLRDQSVTNTQYISSSTASPINPNSAGVGNTYTGRTYTLFDQPQNAQTGYVSASDLKTTRLRDQPPPSTLNLRGTGPLPGPTLTSQNANSQLFRDAGSNGIYYGNANTNSNAGSGTVNNNGQTTYRFSSRFFDVAGNNTEMYYPYRTSTNYNLPQGSSTGTGVQFDQSSTLQTSTMSTTARCALTDPYWCQEYVQIYLSSRQQYDRQSTQQSCPSLIASLAESYNGCCTAVRAAGCQMS